MYRVKVTTVAHDCPIVQELLLVWKTYDETDPTQARKMMESKISNECLLSLQVLCAYRMDNAFD